MRILASDDNIFVKVFEEKQGIVDVPPVFRRRNQVAMSGRVVNCGPNAIIKNDDEIVFNKWQDNEITVNGEKLLLIKPHSILAVR